MCGISAILGTECANLLIESLIQLQNRGYDSAGISLIKDDILIINKYASTESKTAIEQLRNINYAQSINGIAHTRWATHGKKTDINSHPHKSMCEIFSIIHNGIIENYKELKEFLIKNNYKFSSETDTEVIVNLISFYYKKNKNIKESIKVAISELQGTWGLVIQCIDEPNKLYCIRKGSPILIGNNNNFVMIVSEQCGFCNYFDEYSVLDNEDLCELVYEDNKLFINTEKCMNTKKTYRQIQNITPEPFPHWTIKEIYEQADSSLRAISLGGRLMSTNEVKLGGLDMNKHILEKIKNIILLGCGTSLHTAHIGVSYMKDLCDFNIVMAFDGAEFTEKDIPKDGTTAILFLSQSGETKDLHRCINIAKKNHIFTIGIINVPDSLIAREVHCGCYLNAGREIAVASTKSFVSQIIIISMISIWFSQIKHINEEKRLGMIKCLKRLYIDIENTIKISHEKIKLYLKYFENKSSCFVLGKSKGEWIAKEGALKIKEISYIHAEGYSSSALKHGPFALLEKDFPVILIAFKNEHYFKSLNAYEEIKSRNAKIIFISNCDNNLIDEKILIPINESYQDLLSIIPLQILAYELAVCNGINPDIPRNLAKVVTVE
tara:strand:+ start:2301 stop:4124 length:1824 start_codon:yes stop_codon:yes gene_type:complete